MLHRFSIILFNLGIIFSDKEIYKKVENTSFPVMVDSGSEHWDAINMISYCAIGAIVTWFDLTEPVTYHYTAEVVNGGQPISCQSIACWMGNTYRMGLIQDFGSCLSRKQKLGGLLPSQAVGLRLDTFSVAHWKPQTPV